MKRGKRKPLVIKRTENALAGINKLLHRTGVLNLTKYIQRSIVNALNILAQGRFISPFALFSKEIATPRSRTLKPLIGKRAKVSRRLETTQLTGRPSISAEVLKIGQGGQRIGDMINLPLRSLLRSPAATAEESIQKGVPPAQSLRTARNILRAQRLTAPLLHPSLIEKTEPSKIQETKEKEKPRVPIISEKVSGKTRKASYPIPMQQTLQMISRLVSPLLKPISIKDRTLDREIRVTSEGTEMPLESPTFPTISPLLLKEPMEAEKIGEAERAIEEGYSIPVQQNLQRISRLVSPLLKPISIKEKTPYGEVRITSKETEMPLESPTFPTISPLLLKEPMEAEKIGEAERAIEEGYSIPVQQNLQRISRLVSPLLKPISIRERSSVREGKIPFKEIEMFIDTLRTREGKSEKGNLEQKPEESTTYPPGLYISPIYKHIPRIMNLVEKILRAGWGSTISIDEKEEGPEQLSETESIEQPKAPSLKSHAPKYEKNTIIPQEYSSILTFNLPFLVQSIKSSLTRMVSTFLKSEEVNIPLDLRVSTESMKEKKEAVLTCPVVNNTFNISIQAEDLEKEEDLRELADKICKILIDEGRRYGMDLT